MMDKKTDKPKGLRLYRIVTVAKILPQFWRRSGSVSAKAGRSRLWLFADMIGCLIRYGASDENYQQFHFYDIGHEQRSKFITWRRNMSIMYKFCGWETKCLFLDKVRWNRRFAQFVKRDWIYTKDLSEQQISDFVSHREAVVVKTVDGACGTGIELIKSCDLLGNEKKLQDVCDGSFVIEDVAQNIPEIKRFNPHSLNTIRMVTCVDRSGEPHLISAAMRVGSGEGFTDNTHGGGLAAAIDLETGRVYTDGIDFRGENVKAHPATGIVFRGFQVPQWAECKEVALRIAKVVPQARFVGWDIVLTTKGIDVLEGNIPPGEDLTEIAHEGLYDKVMKLY